jgi:hypothetical protein
MSEARKELGQKVTFHITPFDAPEAADFYANVTGVGNTALEVVLVFSQLLPEASVSGLGVVAVRPKLRVSLPPSAAKVLLDQLTQQWAQRAQLEAELSKQEG